MKSIYHFLGSIYFALFLIVSSIILAAAATFIESYTDSHTLAAKIIYQNPFFIALLVGYFINILFATLRRMPFTKEHTGFVITHLGLLMILAGVMSKSFFGWQGHLHLIEGASSEVATLPGSYALFLEDRNEVRQFPLREGEHKEIAFDEHKLTISRWLPHAEEKMLGWFKGDECRLLGLPPLKSKGRPLLCKETLLLAHRGSLSDIAFARPYIAFVEDEEQNVHLVAQNSEGKKHHSALDNRNIYSFDGGFRGYGLVATLPEDFPFQKLVAPLTYEIIAKEPPVKREMRTPAICLLEGNVELLYQRGKPRFTWPILGGKYLAYFGPCKKKIGHRVTLLSTRKIAYPDSDEPLSYESELEIDGTHVIISMNHVHETKRGVRFYMSNITMPNRVMAKEANLVLSYDPCKYWLTYPGCFVLAMGMIILFWKRRYD